MELSVIAVTNALNADDSTPKKNVIYGFKEDAHGEMEYGPFRKSGTLRDTSIQPGQTCMETFEINFPYEDVEKDGKKSAILKHRKWMRRGNTSSSFFYCES